MPCNLVIPISGSECIGDSRIKINNNFDSLCNALTNLSGSLLTPVITPTIVSYFDTTTRRLSSYVRNDSITTNQLADNAVTTAKLAFDSGAFGFRNKVINGGMVIDQRYAGAEQTFTDPSQDFVVDRFRFGGSSGTGLGTWQTRRILLTYPTAPKDFLYSMRLTVSAVATNTATTQKLFSHQIEGSNVIDTNWGDSKAVPCTLSFWVRSTIAGLYPLVVSNGREPTGQPSGHRQQYLTSYTINAANTWEYKQIVIPPRTTGTFSDANNLSDQGIRIDWVVGSRTNASASPSIINNWFAVPNPWTDSEISYNISGSVNLWLNAGAQWQITGVQFEKGSVATPFEQRPVGLELSLCQRYYEDGVAYSGIAITPNANMDHVFHVGFKATKPSNSPTITSVSFVAGAGGFAGTTLSTLTNITEAGFSAYLTNPTQDCGGVLTWTASNEL